MSGHADTIRRRLRGDPSSIGKGHPDALDALNALLAENQRLREFVIAHTLVEKGVTDFDLQNEAVERLRRASEGVKDIIREELAGDGE